MSELDIEIKDAIEKMVDEETNRLVTYYTGELRKFIQNYINAAVRRYVSSFNVNPIVMTQTEADRITVTFEIPPPEIKRIREAVRKKLMEQTSLSRLRIKALARIISSQLLFISGELGAVLSDMHSSTPESADQTGGDREEIRDEEGGHSPQSPTKSNIRGGSVG